MRWSSLCVVLLSVVALLAVHVSAECPPGVELQNCLINPCDAQPCAGASRCEADYCGGCNYNCICTADEDCASDKEFCRPSSFEKDAPSFCTAYATVGESCGGFIPPPFSKQCSPDLTCVYQRFIPDAPGTCYASCSDDTDCGEEFFCSINGYCVEDGGCGETKDCSDPNNSYIVPACVGYASCEQGSCSWTCGDLPACEQDFDCPRDYICDQNTNVCALPDDEPVHSGSCADGSDPLSCLVAPCDIENPCSVAETCVNDYCGGCNARCVCTSDSDCVEGKEWCRTSGVPVPGELGKRVLSYCTPFAGLGESCGGFVLPAFQEICAEGLECAYLNPFIADIPGQCLPTCAQDSDCADELFCSESGFCVEDGQCAVLNDCSNPNNNFISVDCVGYTTCDFGTCGITCGELPACEQDFDCSFGYFCDKNTNTCAVGDGSENPVGECPNGLNLVQCFAEPCSVGSSCKNPKNCYSDYCGGCNTHCTCKSDKDCHAGKEWCRVADQFYQNEESGEILSFCTPFAGLGESCGGFVVPSSLRLCADGLECVNLNPFIADAPGTCMKACSEDRDCRKDSFCSTRGVCVKDGQCGSLSDCFDDNNNYPVIECVGYTTCEESSCGITCGQTPTCEEDFECPFGYACDKASASCVRSTENTCSCGSVDPSGFAICADGSLSGPVCTETSDGDCSFVYRACPEETVCNGRGQCNHAIGGKCLGSCINKQCALSNFDRCYNLEAQIVLLYERIIGLRSIASPSKIADDIAQIISFPRSSIVLLEGANGYVVIEFLQNKKHDAFEAARTLRKLIANDDASIRDSALANLDVLVLSPEAEGDSSVDSSESTQKTDSGRSNSDVTSNTFSDNGNSKSAAAQLVFSVGSLLVAFLLF